MDLSIVYTGFWQIGSPSCSSCKTAYIRGAFNGSWHEGLNSYSPSTASRQSRIESQFGGLPTTLQFNFTGNPHLPGFCVSLIPNLNVTFNLDGQTLSPFHYGGSMDDNLNANQINVFSQANLQNIPHHLVLSVGPGSNAFGLRDSDHGSRRNVAAFAGAIGGSVGLLALLSLGLVISICKRRLAARRSRLDHTDDLPSPSGPVHFVPRFFPGTVIPTDPPSYEIVSSLIGRNSQVLTSLGNGAYLPRPVDGDALCNADRPPTFRNSLVSSDGALQPPPSMQELHTSHGRDLDGESSNPPGLH
ncbi:hypothetical protein AMATHDRAFT_6732 [Amanita thiersii Skay4041]|uniref:Uncharacterized protein n=1 Tax=Amanita thiersii Skay4041 TaxID=703135 RepID=A0A2A9NIA8_9AGAR|nr:hypothetical protein AMATHDRAFT_6732 [Amanita thiersii Skay4041]